MGAVEEGGKVASSIVEGLKANPSCLAALAVVALYGVLQYFENDHQNQRMIERTKEVGAMLDKCITARNTSQLEKIPWSTAKD
jgi:hypothetical protein